MANDHSDGIYISMDDSVFKPVVRHDDNEFRREVFKKNPNAAMVNPDILEGTSNENEGSYEPDIR